MIESCMSVMMSGSSGEFLMEFFKLCCRKETSEEILGRSAVEEEGKGLLLDINQSQISKMNRCTSRSVWTRIKLQIKSRLFL